MTFNRNTDDFQKWCLVCLTERWDSAKSDGDFDDQQFVYNLLESDAATFDWLCEQLTEYCEVDEKSAFGCSLFNTINGFVRDVRIEALGYVEPEYLAAKSAEMFRIIKEVWDGQGEKPVKKTVDMADLHSFLDNATPEDMAKLKAIVFASKNQ